MTLRLVPDAAVEPVNYVPDGDPCPKHGEPSRLLRGATGLFSQCDRCRDDFLAWYYRQHADIRPAPLAPVALIKKQDHSDVPEWRARQILEAQKQPKPAQFGLML